MMEQNLCQTFLYEEDFYGWTNHQADLLRQGRLGEEDLASLAEEIETLGRSEKTRTRIGLQAHLQPSYQADPSARSGIPELLDAIVRERNDVESLPETSPSPKARCLWFGKDL